MGERVEIKNAGGYILYAANTPEPGAQVQIREEPYLFMDDALVAVYPGGVPAYSIAADGMFVETQTDTALLLAAPGTDYPFMENRVRLYLQAPKDPDYYTLGRTARFTALNDLYWFMSNLLLAALLLAVLFFSVAIWARCCKLSRDMKEPAPPACKRRFGGCRTGRHSADFVCGGSAVVAPAAQPDNGFRALRGDVFRALFRTS